MRRKRRHARAGTASVNVNANVVDRVAMTGMVMVVMVGFALVAIVERALLTSDDTSAGSGSRPPQAVRSQGGPDPSRTTSTPRRALPVVASLNGQVRSLTLTERGTAARQVYGARPSAPPLVGATRFTSDQTWAFGTTVIPVPDKQSAMPQVALFLAHWTGDRWQVGLSGTFVFRLLLRRVPTRLMPKAEIQMLARFSRGPNRPTSATKLMLPWQVGDSWTMTTETQGSRPLGSVAFQGGDGRVLAAADGRLYRFCTTAAGDGLLMIVHDSGLASVYYQLTKLTAVRDGGIVKRGDFLGRIGDGTPCGGAATARPQVRFGLRQGSGDVPFDGATIGGWIFREQANPLVGWAQRGTQQVMSGASLTNFGPVDPPSPGPNLRISLPPIPTIPTPTPT
ncbi:MAG: Peptidase family [Actinomycetia bacterium]|nr:Peptidase family [Actinomycetes bacterium]